MAGGAAAALAHGGAERHGQARVAVGLSPAAEPLCAAAGPTSASTSRPTRSVIGEHLIGRSGRGEPAARRRRRTISPSSSNRRSELRENRRRSASARWFQAWFSPASGLLGLIIGSLGREAAGAGAHAAWRRPARRQPSPSRLLGSGACGSFVDVMSGFHVLKSIDRESRRLSRRGEKTDQHALQWAQIPNHCGSFIVRRSKQIPAPPPSSPCPRPAPAPGSEWPTTANQQHSQAPRRIPNPERVPSPDCRVASLARSASKTGTARL
eukprot:COSAG04_NODE_636_length_11710_cov_63.646973_7_plen_267_part_00